MSVVTRFAPSPTGYLHIGGARTALFSYLYAKKHAGRFLLRIEDTDRERSTEEAVKAIFDGMAWLGLDSDQDQPIFQTQRFGRYREVAQQLLKEGKAYRCYCTKQELDDMRAGQMARKEKPRYDGRCRHRQDAPNQPSVIRFKNPEDGATVVNDLIKGDIIFKNAELDDLIIVRSDDTPTYNFCVVVDDWEMGVTHVIRGDDHVNNTPRQINILKALGAQLPQYGHVPMILGADGERLSKRHGAVSVTQYRDEGYLPEALVNYLARLGWSHGDEEIFSKDQLVEWFDLEHVSRSPAQFNPEKLGWINQQYLKAAPDTRLTALLEAELRKRGVQLAVGPELPRVVNLIKDRANTVAQLADEAMLFYALEVKPAPAEWNGEALKALRMLKARLGAVSWERAAINQAIKETVKSSGLKMPQVAMPLRHIVTGRTQTPSIDAVLELLGRDTVLLRLGQFLETD